MIATSNTPTLGAALLSTSIAIAALQSTAFHAHSQVVFDDGKMHVIDDDSYAFERIEVRNGSKLKILDGAVISASASPDYDFYHNDSGLQVLDYSAAAIRVYDKSMLIVQGGTFGGEPFEVNPYPGEEGNPDNPPHGFENNWYSGAIAAFGKAKVMVHGGSFGTGAFRSGAIAIFDDARLKVSGGTFTNPGGSGGRIELFERGDAKISGGTHGSSIAPDDYSSLHISGGFFGKDDGFRRGALLAFGHSSSRISGGVFGGAGFMSGYVAVGDLFTSAAEWDGDPTIVIEGGDFGGTGTFAGIIHQSKPRGTIVIKGSGFNFPFGPVETAATSPFAGPPTQLLGTLSSGESIDTSIYKENGEDAVIELVED